MCVEGGVGRAVGRQHRPTHRRLSTNLPPSLAVNVVTPTTKAADHDEPITPADIVGRGLMTQAQWDEAAATALRLFAFGQAEAAKRGLLLVDTKYELGVDPSTERILVVDEVHTPDSSRCAGGGGGGVGEGGVVS